MRRLTSLLRSLRWRRGPRLRDELADIRTRTAALPLLNDRTADEIIGYDEHGLPR